MINPKIFSQKHSGGPNLSNTSASCGADFNNDTLNIAAKAV